MAVFMYVGAQPQFSANVQSGTGTTSATVPGSTKAGDMLFFYTYASSGSAIPSPVSPSGFTNVIDTFLAVSGASSRAVRMMGFYKLANGSEGGTSIAGMNGTLVDSCAVLLFPSQNGPFGTLTPLDIAQSSVRNSSISQTINCAGQTVPLVALAMSERTASSPGLTMSPVDGSIQPSALCAIAWKIYNISPSNVSCSVANSGFENSLGSLFITGTYP